MIGRSGHSPGSDRNPGCDVQAIAASMRVTRGLRRTPVAPQPGPWAFGGQNQMYRGAAAYGPVAAPVPPVPVSATATTTPPTTNPIAVDLTGLYSGPPYSWEIQRRRWLRPTPSSTDAAAARLSRGLMRSRAGGQPGTLVIF